MDALAQLERATAVFLDDLSNADTTAKTARTDFTVEDLVAHLGSVHRWAAGVTTSLERGDLDGRPQTIGDPVQWYRDSRDILFDALREADPDAPCYTMSKTATTVSFWYRRQLHETLIHLWDLRSAASPQAPAPVEFDAETWADGVLEMIEVFPQRFGDKAPLPGVLRLQAADAPGGVTIGTTWQPVAESAPAAVITGPAGELALYAWSRKTLAEAGLSVEGDPLIAEAFSGTRVHP